MKKLMIIGLGAILLFSCKNDSKKAPADVKLTVVVNGLDIQDGDYLFVKDLANRKSLDSVALVANQSEYNMSFVPATEDAYFITLNKKGIQNSTFITSGGDVKETIDFPLVAGDNVVVKQENTNEANQAFQEYEEQKQPFLDKLDALYGEYQQLKADGKMETDEEIEAFDIRYQAVAKEKDDFAWKFVKEHKDVAGLVVLSTDLRYNDDYENLKTAVESFPDTYKNNELYVAVEDRKNNLANVQMGSVAPNFSAPNPDGEMVSVEDFRGKYLLIDFWASWCGPCRGENPNLVKTYAAYKDKGFEILGVSYDNPDARDKWLKAIEDDKLTWSQVSNLKGWEDPTTKLYVITGIPSPFLLDPEGKIIAKGDELRGEGLENKLTELGL